MNTKKGSFKSESKDFILKIIKGFTSINIRIYASIVILIIGIINFFIMFAPHFDKSLMDLTSTSFRIENIIIGILVLFALIIIISDKDFEMY